jgi:hypothetical protein
MPNLHDMPTSQLLKALRASVAYFGLDNPSATILRAELERRKRCSARQQGRHHGAKRAAERKAPTATKGKEAHP